MKRLRKPHIVISALLAGIAVIATLSPQAVQQVLTLFESNNPLTSQHFKVVPNSASTTNTFRVKDGSREVTVALCGLTALKEGHLLEGKSRDYLQRLLDRGKGSVALVPVTKDGKKQMSAEAFIMLPGGRRELHLNSQMLSRGMAKATAPTIGDCPNTNAMQLAEEEAKRQANGIWAQPVADINLAE